MSTVVCDDPLCAFFEGRPIQWMPADNGRVKIRLCPKCAAAFDAGDIQIKPDIYFDEPSIFGPFDGDGAKR